MLPITKPHVSRAAPAGSHAEAAPCEDPSRSPAEPLRFALVTPSYYLDFEACRWLVESVNRYVPEDIPHYLIVDGADHALFAPLASSRTHVLHKEDALRGRLRQLPFARKWWVGRRPAPVRGWIVQQITKLLVTELLDEQAFAFVDSGCFFVRPFDPRGLQRGRSVRLFRESGDYFRNRLVQRWHGVAAKLLGIRAFRDYDVGYVNPLVTWRRDNLLQLQHHIELVSGEAVIDCLARQLTLSECYVYGMYCDLILGSRSGHYHESVASSLAYWGADTLSQVELGRLRERLAPEHVLVLVNEKSGTSVDAVRRAFA